MAVDNVDGVRDAMPLICVNNWKKVSHFFDAFLLLVVQLIQACILNYYMIAHFRSSVLPYVWFLGDFLCLFVFASTLTISFKYFFHVIKTEAVGDGTSFSLSPHRWIVGYSITKFGVLPLSYISWMFYAALLIAKVAVIFKTEIPESLQPSDIFGPQLLQITIALAAIIFLLLAESHNWAKHRSTRYHFVTSTCTHAGLAVLDTVSLLSVLLASNFTLKSPPPDVLLDIVLALSLINLTLPALALHRLALSEPTAERKQAQLTLPFGVFNDLLHLALVDVPFLIVRAYLWIGYGQQTSLFMMKNVLAILATLRNLHPDMSELIARRRLHIRERADNPQTSRLLALKDMGSAPEEQPMQKQLSSHDEK